MVLIAMTVRDIKALLHALADDRSCKSSFYILIFDFLSESGSDADGAAGPRPRPLCAKKPCSSQQSARAQSEEIPRPGRGFQGSRVELAARKTLGIPGIPSKQSRERKS